MQPSVKKINSEELLMEVDIDETINKLCNDLFPNQDKNEINEALGAICGECTVKSDKTKLYFDRLNEILKYYLSELLSKIIISRCKKDEYRCSLIRLFSEMEKLNNQDKNTNFNFNPIYEPSFTYEWMISPRAVQATRFKNNIIWIGTSPNPPIIDFDHYLPLNFKTNVVPFYIIKNNRIVIWFRIEFIVPAIASCTFYYSKYHPVRKINFEYEDIIRNYESGGLRFNSVDSDIQEFLNIICSDLYKKVKYFIEDARKGNFKALKGAIYCWLLQINTDLNTWFELWNIDTQGKDTIISHVLDTSCNSIMHLKFIQKQVNTHVNYSNSPAFNSDHLHLKDDAFSKAFMYLRLSLIKLVKNSTYSQNSRENSINDYIRDVLESGLNHDLSYQILDQTRQGTSTTGLDAGELDLLIKYNNADLLIIEGQRLDSIDKQKIITHINKATCNYNSLSCNVAILLYCEAQNYVDLIGRYLEFVEDDYNVQLSLKEDLGRLKIYFTEWENNGTEFNVYFCFTNVYR